jgi:hypothetical protein
MFHRPMNVEFTESTLLIGPNSSESIRPLFGAPLQVRVGSYLTHCREPEVGGKLDRSSRYLSLRGVQLDSVHITDVSIFVLWITFALLLARISVAKYYRMYNPLLLQLIVFHVCNCVHYLSFSRRVELFWAFLLFSFSLIYLILTLISLHKNISFI